MSEVEVTDNPAENRYEARVDSELAGIAEYHLTKSSIVFTHTEVFDGHEGKGVGSALARHALDDVRAKGGRDVVPVCPFVHGWIATTPSTPTWSDATVRTRASSEPRQRRLTGSSFSRVQPEPSRRPVSRVQGSRR
jgi:predicted GNAT family acetyltransferase